MKRNLFVLGEIAAANVRNELRKKRRNGLVYGIIGLFGLTAYAGFVVWLGVVVAQHYDAQHAAAVIALGAVALALTVAAIFSIVIKREERWKNRQARQIPLILAAALAALPAIGRSNLLKAGALGLAIAIIAGNRSSADKADGQEL